MYYIQSYMRRYSISNFIFKTCIRASHFLQCAGHASLVCEYNNRLHIGADASVTHGTSVFAWFDRCNIIIELRFKTFISIATFALWVHKQLALLHAIARTLQYIGQPLYNDDSYRHTL